jgi:hypothetical protein
LLGQRSNYEVLSAVGTNPYNPQKAAGPRIELAVSVAIEIGEQRQLTIPASPPDDPLVVLEGSQGF